MFVSVMFMKIGRGAGNIANGKCDLQISSLLKNRYCMVLFADVLSFTLHVVHAEFGTFVFYVCYAFTFKFVSYQSTHLRPGNVLYVYL